jgi:hypothetical protein
MGKNRTLDEDIEALMAEWREISLTLPHAKAKMKRMDEMKKPRLALAMIAAGKAGVKVVAAQEREAYASDDFIQYLNEYEAAVVTYEALRLRSEGIMMKAELIRTREASNRREKNGYGVQG